MALRTATHLGAVVVGAACWWAWPARTDDSGATLPPPQASPAGVSSLPSVRGSLQARMKKNEEDRQQRQESLDRRVREAALEVIAKGPEEQRKKEARLAELRSLADTYRNTADLRRVLADTLVAGEDDSSIAIFLEWHRRDPDGAFDELAKLSAWSGRVLDEEAVALEVGNDGMVAQLAKEDRPYGIWRELAGLCGRSMGDADQLAALADAFARIPQERAEEMISGFLENWVPDQGAEAARFLMQAPEKFRREFLSQLKDGAPDVPNWGWTDEFAATLLGMDLGSCEDLRGELASEAGRTGNPVFSSCLPPERPLGSIAKIENAGEIERVMGKLLYRDRDYPELFASGEMDLPAIHAAILAQMEGAEAYPEAVAEVLFKGLAIERPEEAMAWARDKLPQEEIARLSTLLILAADEPRLSRRARLLAALPTRTAEVPRWWEDRVATWRTSFQEWTALAADPAAAAVGELPPESLLNPPPEGKEKP